MKKKAVQGINDCRGSVTLFQANSHNNLNQDNDHRNGEEESKPKNNMKKNQNNFRTH